MVIVANKALQFHGERSSLKHELLFGVNADFSALLFDRNADFSALRMFLIEDLC